ncbi:MAG TPA: hypothetical protein VJL58_11290 [Pyrinomonadaceae bacterium]|nr:hypothetical protein [Pyrinomonadaceae bacterium]
MSRSTGFAVMCVLMLSFFGNAFATTWFPKEFSCPIDNEKNTFMVIGSYGSYIYSWPSKYQWLFFPQTESPTYYMCKKCHLATYMWDFDKLPKEKLPEIKRILSTINVAKPFKDYQEVPLLERLEAMEKVYSVLGKGEDWWEMFYRVKGYHNGKAGEAAKAAHARQKSLANLEKAYADPKSESPKKLTLYVIASMKHFLNDDSGALATFDKALATKYENKSESADDVKAGEEGLNERIKDYITRIKSEKDKPRLFDKYSPDEH